MAATFQAIASSPVVDVTEVTVALIADDPELRGRVREALLESRAVCAADAASPDEAAAFAELASVDAIIVSVGSTSSERLEAFKAVRKNFPDTPLVGVWPDTTTMDERRALKSGVDGVIRETQIEESLGAALRAICSGLTCVPRQMRAQLQSTALSSREKQILGMLVMGFTNSQIAGRLYLAESTVKSHLSSAYTKLGVRSRKDAAALILDPDAGLGPGILAIAPAS
jgi:DNA-binding NarL/FixJ family response regulator